MQNTIALVRLNLHLRTDHLHRLIALAGALAKRKGRDTRLAEAIELALTAGLSWTNDDLIAIGHSDREQPHWLALGPIVRTR